MPLAPIGKGVGAFGQFVMSPTSTGSDSHSLTLPLPSTVKMTPLESATKSVSLASNARPFGATMALSAAHGVACKPPVGGHWYTPPRTAMLNDARPPYTLSAES